MVILNVHSFQFSRAGSGEQSHRWSQSLPVNFWSDQCEVRSCFVVVPRYCWGLDQWIFWLSESAVFCKLRTSLRNNKFTIMDMMSILMDMNRSSVMDVFRKITISFIMRLTSENLEELCNDSFNLRSVILFEISAYQIEMAIAFNKLSVKTCC